MSTDPGSLEDATDGSLVPQPRRRGQFEVTSTSANSATVTPLTLRETDSVRLVFKPMLVNNQKNTNAAVDGTFCYQRKRKADTWDDVETISFTSLKSGEGYKLSLSSSEVLKLFSGLDVLYREVRANGVPVGTHTYIQADSGSLLGDFAHLLDEGGITDVLKVFLDWSKDRATELSTSLAEFDANTLLNFDAAVGVARLRRFVTDAKALLTSSSESKWQSLLEQQSWAVSQVYASPLIIIRGQAYVGGKNIENRDGSIVDYLFKNALSQNSVLVEIKHPLTDLMTDDTYRNQIFGPSKELSGATQQLLHARQTLQEDYSSLTRSSESRFNIFATRALLLIGTLPTEPAKLRSFEIYRYNLRGLDIVTFDEMVKKAELLIEAMS